MKCRNFTYSHPIPHSVHLGSTIRSQIESFSFVEHIATFERLFQHGLFVAHVREKLRREERKAHMGHQLGQILFACFPIKIYPIQNAAVDNLLTCDLKTIFLNLLIDGTDLIKYNLCMKLSRDVVTSISSDLMRSSSSFGLRLTNSSLFCTI